MKAKTRWPLLAALVLLALCLLCGPRTYQAVQQLRYPCRYSQQVERYAAEYGLDPLLLYAFIRTESGFDPQARSSVGARGLMQITETTFDWLHQQLGDGDQVSFDDLDDPETNIRYGSYYISRCLSRYDGDISTAAAAYHSGWGTVDALLESEAYSQNGSTLDVFPYNQMQNYVAKINSAYDKYRLLYATEGA